MGATLALWRPASARATLDRTRHGGCLHRLFPRLRRDAEPSGPAMKTPSALQAVRSVAEKEFIHIYRDWRILVLLLILPPVFTLIFGHAFEATAAKNVPALLENADHSPESDAFVRQLLSGTTFRWKQ